MKKHKTLYPYKAFLYSHTYALKFSNRYGYCPAPSKNESHRENLNSYNRKLKLLL